MIEGIELQVISKILTCEDDEQEIRDALMSYRPEDYFSVYSKEIEYIHDHRDKYGILPSIFNFQLEFPNFTPVQVTEPLEYLIRKLKENRKRILLIETFNKMKDLGDGDINEAWQYIGMQHDKTQVLEDTDPMDIVKDVQKRADQILEYSKQQRIPTGFDELDKLTYGGFSTIEELVVLIARTNAGKAQPLWAPVLTPDGWTTMGDLKVGDTVVGANNDNGKVVELFPQGEKEYYRVHFDDGTYAECCDDHLWTVLDGKRRESANAHYGEHMVLTTKELRSNLDKKYSVDISDPIEFNVPFDEDKELDPYLLGLIIGDGGLRDNRVILSNESEEIWSTVECIIDKCACKRSDKDRFSIIGIEYGNNFVRDKIIEYGLMNKKSIDKFIPRQYLTAPVHIRKALLAGLLDTDGYCSADRGASWEFDTASEQLAKDFAELARSLGVWVKVHPRKPSYYVKDGVRIEASGFRHLACRSTFNPFRFSAKANRFTYRDTTIGKSRPKRHCKMIKDIEFIGRTQCQCILLDNNSHTYITNDFIVTHNTWVCTRMMESAQRNGFPVAYYSPEMQAAYLGTRFDTWRGHFENSKLYRGDYSTEYLNYIKALEGAETPAYVIEDKDFPDGVSIRTLEPFVKKNGIKLLIIDGISYMEDDRKATRDQEKYKNIAMGLFSLSKKYGCACVLVMQANREVKSKDDKGESIPTLYNAEGSDQPARIATLAFGIRQIFDKHVLDIGLLKSRTSENKNPVFSYAWDVNTGQAQYIPGDDSVDGGVGPGGGPAMVTPQISTPTISFGNAQPDANDLSLLDDSDDDVEF